MMNISRQSTLAVTVSVFTLCATIAYAAADEPECTVTQKDATVTMAVGDRPVMEYRFADVPFKPYVAKLYSPDGAQILRDSPSDHKHHHGLMYGLKVDGVDFWSERDKCGSQKSQAIECIESIAKNQFKQAKIGQRLVWTEPKQDKPLLLEQRMVDITSRGGQRPVTLLTWQTRLSTPPGKDSVELTGDHYFGLGMRFLASMDKGGRFFSSTGKLGEVVRGEERLVPADWCAYTAKADGKPVTVAVFDDPKNPRHPAKMFTMTGHFAYLAATANVWKQPLVLKAGSPRQWRYGVALWDGVVEPAEIETVYQAWVAENKHEK